MRSPCTEGGGASTNLTGFFLISAPTFALGIPLAGYLRKGRCMAHPCWTLLGMYFP